MDDPLDKEPDLKDKHPNDTEEENDAKGLSALKNKPVGQRDDASQPAVYENPSKEEISELVAPEKPAVDKKTE